MIPLDSGALRTLAGSHSAPVVMYVRSGTDIIAALPDSGQVTADIERGVQRQLQFTLPGSELAPVGQIGALSPLAGSTISVYRGVTRKVARRGSPFTDAFGPEFDHMAVAWADDETYWVPTGVFTPVTTSVASSASGDVLTVDAEDKSTALNREWTRELAIPYGTPTGEALEMVLAENKIAEANYEIDLPPEYRTPALLLGADTNSTPLNACIDLAKVCGYRFYADAVGIFRTAPMAATSDPPQIVLDGSLVTKIERTVRIGDAINGVVVRTEGSAMLVPVRAEMWDDDPSSPLYRAGVFGESGRVLSSAKITDQAQADQVARVLFGAWAGVEFSLEMIPQPHIEVGDVVAVQAAGVDVRGVVTSMTLPLAPGSSQRLTVRTRGLL